MRLAERMKAHYENDVWEKRESPPKNWNTPLPPHLQVCSLYPRAYYRLFMAAAWCRACYATLEGYIIEANPFVLIQGQARRYGRITHFLPLPLEGHDFHRAHMTKPMGRFQTPRCQMKEMDIIFQQMPFGLM